MSGQVEFSQQQRISPNAEDICFSVLLIGGGGGGVESKSSPCSLSKWLCKSTADPQLFMHMGQMKPWEKDKMVKPIKQKHGCNGMLCKIHVEHISSLSNSVVETFLNYLRKYKGLVQNQMHETLLCYHKYYHK